jgi:hypothetical protein
VQVEEKQFLSVRVGMERTLRTRQRQWLEEAALSEHTQQRARQVHLQHTEQLQRAKADFVRQYDAKVHALHEQQRSVRPHPAAVHL